MAGFLELPLWLRCAFGAGSVAAFIGGVVGFVIGLHVHPATAWFAVIEAGLLAGIGALLVGALVGGVVEVVRWTWASRRAH